MSPEAGCWSKGVRGFCLIGEKEEGLEGGKKGARNSPGQGGVLGYDEQCMGGWGEGLC